MLSIYSTNSSNKEFGSIISHCQQLIRTQLINSKIEFSRRQTNEVTHELTQTTLLEANSQLFIDVPPYINDLLSNEMR